MHKIDLLAEETELQNRNLVVGSRFRFFFQESGIKIDPSLTYFKCHYFIYRQTSLQKGFQQKIKGSSVLSQIIFPLVISTGPWEES